METPYAQSMLESYLSSFIDDTPIYYLELQP
jgi:hypothetical protein